MFGRLSAGLFVDIAWSFRTLDRWKPYHLINILKLMIAGEECNRKFTMLFYEAYPDY
jgi:hypothetical protein